MGFVIFSSILIVIVYYNCYRRILFLCTPSFLIAMLEMRLDYPKALLGLVPFMIQLTSRVGHVADQARSGSGQSLPLIEAPGIHRDLGLYSIRYLRNENVSPQDHFTRDLPEDIFRPGSPKG